MEAAVAAAPAADQAAMMKEPQRRRQQQQHREPPLKRGPSRAPVAAPGAPARWPHRRHAAPAFHTWRLTRCRGAAAVAGVALADGAGGAAAVAPLPSAACGW